MGIGSANPLLLASAASGGDDSGSSDPVTRSLRWDDGNNSDLYKATGSTDTTWTVAMWIKRSKLSSLQYFFSWGGDGINFDSSDRISIWNGSAYRYTTAVFRDTSSWYHLTISCNAGTITIYVNGVAHALSSSVSYPAWGNVYFGRWSGNTSYNFDGYLADIYGIEGSALDHTSFTESNDYGGLKPKEYTGSFGTNGFHIDAQPAHDADLLVSSIARNDGDTQFADAAQGHGLVRYGSTHHDDTVGNPFDSSGTAIHFNGSGDRIKVWDGSSGDYQLGANDYTIECWFNLSSQCATGASCYRTIFQGYNNINGHLFERGGMLFYYTGAASSSYVYDTSITDVDVNTWHHVAVVRDGNTISIYLDGSLNSSKTRTGGWTEPNSTSSQPFRIGGGDHYYWDGYIYDFRVTGGEAKYTGSTYTVPSAPFELNPIYIGGDQSGNKNHFQPTNISGHDVMLDVPYPKNYATLNPVGYIDEGTDATFAEGNLKITGGDAQNKIPSTIAVSSGKWYAEVRVNNTSHMMMGVAKTSAFTVDGYYLGQSGTDDSWMIYRSNGNEYHNGSNSKFSSAFSVGDILQIALDLDNNKLWWGKNGTWVGTVGTNGETTITAGEYYFAHGYSGGTATWNFGQDNTFGGLFTGTPNNAEFAYEIPTGFKSLNTSNLDAPSVTPTSHFNTVLYNGSYDGYNGTGTDSQSITGVGFSPDIVWVKDRDGQSDTYGNAYSAHYWFDAVLGAGSPVNIDAGQGISGSLNSGYNGVNSFDSDGFSVDEADETNYSADTDEDSEPDTPERYVAWCWKLGTTASSWSGSGQDPDSEQYNSDAGMSVINYYDGDYAGTSITFNHSLGAAPEFAMALDYEGYHGANYAWHKDLSSGNYLDLSSTGSQTSDSTYFPSSPATNTTFEMGVSLVDGIQSHVALFRSVEGFSKFGSYEGVGSNGVFVYTGHRPKMIWIKNKTGTGNWFIFDAVRDTYNEAVNYLRPNSYGTETTNSGYKLDILSNGFRINVESSHMNNSSYEYIFCSFAEQPFAAPSNAR